MNYCFVLMTNLNCNEPMLLVPFRLRFAMLFLSNLVAETNVIFKGELANHLLEVDGLDDTGRWHLKTDELVFLGRCHKVPAINWHQLSSFKSLVLSSREHRQRAIGTSTGSNRNKSLQEWTLAAQPNPGCQFRYINFQ